MSGSGFSLTPDYEALDHEYAIVTDRSVSYNTVREEVSPVDKANVPNRGTAIVTNANVSYNTVPFGARSYE